MVATYSLSSLHALFFGLNKHNEPKSSINRKSKVAPEGVYSVL